MIKKFIPALTATFIAFATPAKADDVRVVVVPEATQPGAIDFRVYKGNEKVWTTALQCKALRAMGVDRVSNMIRAYAQDAVEEVNGRWEAAQFEKQLTERLSAPVYSATVSCAFR